MIGQCGYCDKVVQMKVKMSSELTALKILILNFFMKIPEWCVIYHKKEA